MTAQIVKFPSRRQRRMLAKLGIDYDDRRAELDTQIREMNHAIAALQRNRAALLAEYRAALRREAEAQSERGRPGA